MGLEACWCFHSAASCLSPTGHRPAGWQKCRNFGLCCLPACELPKKHCNLQVLVMGTWTLDPFAQRNHRGGLLTYPRSPSNRWLPWDWKPGPKCQFSWFSQIPSLPTLPLTFFFFLSYTFSARHSPAPSMKCRYCMKCGYCTKCRYCAKQLSDSSGRYVIKGHNQWLWQVKWLAFNNFLPLMTLLLPGMVSPPQHLGNKRLWFQ